MLPLYGSSARNDAALTVNVHGRFCGFACPMSRPSHEADTALVRCARRRRHCKSIRVQFCAGGRRRFKRRMVTLLTISSCCQAASRTFGRWRRTRLPSGELAASVHCTGERSTHNSFLVTERCNHYCLMCSQPPRDIDDRWLLDEIEAAIELVDPQTKSFAFTGGEPLLEWRGFIRLLERCRDALPNTAVHVLTNGRGFANTEVAKAWAAVRHPNLMAGIPIYSAVDHIHNYVVQAHDAFDETVLGILKLKDQGQRVEIRVVLHGITAPRIVETCRWLARNLPFVDHVALMGLENTGFTLANNELLWIDPVDYQDDLAICRRSPRIGQGASLSLQSSSLCACKVDLAIRGAVDFGLEERLRGGLRRVYRTAPVCRVLHFRPS